MRYAMVCGLLLLPRRWFVVIPATGTESIRSQRWQGFGVGIKWIGGLYHHWWQRFAGIAPISRDSGNHSRRVFKGDRTWVVSAVKRTKSTKVATSARSWVVAESVLLTMLGVGALMECTGLLWSQRGLAPGKPVHLTQEETKALRWATSAEGTFARNLIEWNSDSLTDLEYKKDVKLLGVTLEVAGRPANSGFCTIWVEPPERRKFKD